MAGRFDFDSPGAAFVDTMARVLAERKAEERQAMLDRLTQSAEERASRAEERAMTQQGIDNQWRQSQIDHQTWQRENSDFDTLQKFVDPEKPLDEQNLTPQQLELLSKRGAVRKRPKTTAGVTTDESFGAPAGAGYSVEGQDSEPWLGDFGGQGSPAPKPAPAAPKPPEMQSFFAGTSEYQQTNRLKQQHGNLVVGMLSSEKPRDREIGQALARMMQNNGGLIPKEGRDLLMPNKPVFAYENESGEFTELEGGVPSGAQIIQRTRPPKPPAQPRQRFIGANPEGHPIFERPDGSVFVDNTVQIGGKDTTRRALGAPNAAMEEHGFSVQMMANPTPEAVEMFRHTANAVIEQSTMSQKARSLAQMYLINPDAVAARIDSEPMTEQDKQEFLRIISLIGMDRYREHLKPKK